MPLNRLLRRRLSLSECRPIHTLVLTLRIVTCYLSTSERGFEHEHQGRNIQDRHTGTRRKGPPASLSLSRNLLDQRVFRPLHAFLARPQIRLASAEEEGVASTFSASLDVVATSFAATTSSLVDVGFGSSAAASDVVSAAAASFAWATSTEVEEAAGAAAAAGEEVEEGVAVMEPTTLLPDAPIRWQPLMTLAPQVAEASPFSTMALTTQS